MKILQVLSSAKGEYSVSTQLANAIVEKLRSENPDSSVIVKDLATLQPPHLNQEILVSFSTPAEARSEPQNQAVAFSDHAIREVIEADVIVVGLAFYNYSVPSALKAWIDHISRARITFRYNERGEQVGILKSKPVYVAVASGGIYRLKPMEAMDFGKNYFALAMRMIGLNDTRFFVADGQGIPGYQVNSLSNAIESIVL